MPLNAATRIPQQDFHPFFAAQYLFIRQFDSRFAFVIARHIIGIFLNLTPAHFAQITQQMSAVRIRIFPYRPVLDIKAWKLIQLLLQNATLLGRQMVHKHLRHIRRISRIQPPVFYVGDSLHKLFFGNIQYLAKIERIKWLHLPHHHHHFIRRLVVHKQFAISIVHDSPGGIQCFFQKSIAVCPRLVVIIDHLQKEQTDNENKNHQNNDAAYHVASVFERIFCINLHLAVLPN